MNFAAFAAAGVFALVAFLAGVYLGDRFLPVTALVAKVKKVVEAAKA